MRFFHANAVPALNVLDPPGTRNLENLSTFWLRAPPLLMRREHRETFPDEAGKGTLISSGGGENRGPLKLWQEPRCSSRVETGMSGTLSCSKVWRTLSRFLREA